MTRFSSWCHFSWCSKSTSAIIKGLFPSLTRDIHTSVACRNKPVLDTRVRYKALFHFNLTHFAQSMSQSLWSPNSNFVANKSVFYLFIRAKIWAGTQHVNAIGLCVWCIWGLHCVWHWAFIYIHSHILVRFSACHKRDK